jgi:hypothetical protein
MRVNSLLTAAVLAAISTISSVVPSSAMTHSGAGSACAAQVQAVAPPKIDDSGSRDRHRRALYISCMHRHGFRA